VVLNVLFPNHSPITYVLRTYDDWNLRTEVSSGLDQDFNDSRVVFVSGRAEEDHIYDAREI